MNLTHFQEKMERMYAKMQHQTNAKTQQIQGYRLSFTSKMDCFSCDLPAYTSCKQKSEVCYGILCKGKRKGSCYGTRGNFRYSNCKLLRDNNLRTLLKHGAGSLEAWLVPTLLNIMPDFFRFHSTGDVQNYSHLQAILSTARKLPKTNMFLPTHYTKLLLKACINDNLPRIPKNMQIKLSCIRGTRQEKRCLETQQAILSRQKNANVHLAYVYRSLDELDGLQFWACPVSPKNSGFKSCTEAKCRFCFLPIKGNVAYKYH